MPIRVALLVMALIESHFDLKLTRMSSLLRVASGKESAHDAGHERRRDEDI